ncbi:MAG TPA: choice-of-anchor L domain-containing protein, partial [Prolixibacteraceae bacterium]|nr:choice-of-anchor L domain-containing protein [Prolixibacteraceae bacterium]
METARLPKITELTGEGNHMTRHVKNLWKFSSLYGCLFILMAFLIGMNAYGQVIPAQVTQEEAIDEMKVPVLLEESEVPSSRDRFNIPYPKPEMTLKSGNFTDNSAIDVRGITNQFYIMAGVVNNADYECITDYPFRTASSYERTQMLFLASEIGPAPKTLNLMELARKVTGSSEVSNFTVRLMHTSLTTFTGQTNYVDMSAGKTVFSASPFTIPNGSGSCGFSPDNNFTWMTINFQDNFEYNGTSNLIVEITWGPVISGTTSRAVLGGDYSEQRVIYGYGNSANPARSGNNVRRPNIRFGYRVPVFGDGTITNLVNEFIQGCATVSNVTFTGNPRAIGFFERRPDKTEDFPFEKGIVISTGQVTDAAGPNSSGSKTTQFESSGSGGSGTRWDEAELKFDFIPNASSVSFQYIFASEEFREYCGQQYNDAFSFYISGPGITGEQNIALLPNNSAVTINNVCNNNSYYVANDPGSFTIEFDGRTILLTATANISQPCSTYTLRMVIADLYDSKWDSGIFLEAESFGAPSNVSFENFNYKGQNTNNVFMVCNPNVLRVQRPQTGDLSEAITVPVTIGGTAVYGTHYTFNSYTPVANVIHVTIPAGQWFTDVSYTLLDNPISGGAATLEVSTPGGCPCGGSLVKKVINLNETYSFHSVTPKDATTCTETGDGEIEIILDIEVPTNQFLFTYRLKTGSGTTIGSFNTNETTYTFTGLKAGTYIVEVVDNLSCTVLSQEVTVDGPGLPVVDCPDDQVVCLNAPAFTLTGATPSGGTYNGPGVTAGVFYPATAGVGTHTIYYNYTDPPGSSCTGNCFFTIEVKPVPTVTCPAGSSVCIDAAPFRLAGGAPSGGTYSGPGVSDGIFSPAIAGLGAKTITYTYSDPYGCSNSCSFTITVNNVPTVTCPDDFEVPYSASPVTLSGANPSGGIYYGPGVTAGVFYPETAGVGTHTITYTYTDGNQCDSYCEFYIKVYVDIPCNITGDAGPLCPSERVTYSGPDGTGLTYAWSISGNGSIDGPANQQDVDVIAGTGCNEKFTLQLTVTYANYSSRCDIGVNVNDTQKPVISTVAENNKYLGCNPGPIEDPVFTGLDDCAGVFTPTVTKSDPFNYDSYCDWAITWTATWTDLCGNPADVVSITYYWTEDTTLPEITCPDDVTLYTDGTATSTTFTVVTPAASDNCTASSTLTVTGVRSDGKPLNDPWPLGTTTITWTAAD